MSTDAPSPNDTILCVTSPTSSGGVRVDRFLADLFPGLNRSQLQRAMRSSRVRVNGSPLGKKQGIALGDRIEIGVESTAANQPHAVEIPLDVQFEDEDIIVVNKPAGMVTHPGSGTGNNTLVHALLHHCGGRLSELNGADRPGIVHRLDKDTSGLLVAAKSDPALVRLIEAFRSREPEKRYLALSVGCPQTQAGHCTGAIARHPVQRLKMAVMEEGKAAHTDWHLRASGDGFCLMECKILTGRTHQIRVHLSHMGHPIVGDALYGYRPSRHPAIPLSATRPLLHSWRLALHHPISGKSLKFEVAVPEDFEPWMTRLTHPGDR